LLLEEGARDQLLDGLVDDAEGLGLGDVEVDPESLPKMSPMPQIAKLRISRPKSRPTRTLATLVRI
jgi:hypothetical protein